MFAVAGFSLTWWWQISIPVALLVAISGFVIYRYRQTRAFTIGQFHEMRYSRKFRLLASGLAFFAGMINFGISPVIGARFITNFLGLPQAVSMFEINYDLKVTDPTLHEKYTGVPLSPILENLSALDRSGAKIILRCPIAPVLNNREGYQLS